MAALDVLMLFLGISLSVHTATAAILFSRHAGHDMAEAAFAAGATAASTFTLWISVISIYR